MSFSPFVSAQITTDAGVLTDQSIDLINSTLTANGYPSWSPSDGDLAVIILGIVAQIAADVAQVASTVVPAIFRAYGTQLFGLPYSQGTYATVGSTWGFTSPAPVGGFTIPAATVVMVGGQPFYVQNAYTSGTGDTSATIQLVAAEIGGAAWNGLGGVGQQAPLNSQLDWVTGGYCILSGASTGGTDQQTDADYQTSLKAVLALQAPRPVTATDFAAFLLSDACAEATGIAVGRATSIDGYYPAPRALATGAGAAAWNCTTVNGSPIVTVNSATTRAATVGATVTGGIGVPAGATVSGTPMPTPTSFTMSTNAGAGAGTGSLTVSQVSNYAPASLTCVASYAPGSPTVVINSPPYLGAIPFTGGNVTGPGIPAGATVLASPSTTGLTLSQNPIATENGVTVTVDQWTTVMSCTTTFVTDANGNALSAVTMDALASWLGSYRQLNFLAFVEPPTYSPVYVTVAVHCLPGAAVAATLAAVQTAIIAYLSPATWGTVRNAGWLNSGQGYNIVRFNSLIAVAESVSGVQYVPNGAMTLGAAPGPTGTADIALVGAAPLPQASVSTIVVTAA